MKLVETLALVTALKSMMWENVGSKSERWARCGTTAYTSDSLIAPVNFEYTVRAVVLISMVSDMAWSSSCDKPRLAENCRKS
jgi:hypothetical protein